MLGLAPFPRALRWLALPLALGLTQVAFEPTAAAAPKAKTGKKKKPKKTGGSMDDTAGADVEASGAAPGTKDSHTSDIEMVDETPKKKKKGEVEAENVQLEEEDETPPAPDDSNEPPPPFSVNWFSFSIQQSFLVYGNTKNVCPSADDNGKSIDGVGGYSCRDATGAHKGAVYSGAGNEVHGGVGLADLRFMLGYDRLLVGRLMLGARFGAAVLQAPAVTGTRAPLPIHAEARMAYYFGESPFMGTGIRPYVGFAVGLGEIDGKVSVVYYKDHQGFREGKQGRLDVWRNTGPGFVAVSGGVSYPVGNFMLSAEARMLGMLLYPGFAPAILAGVAYGL
jgi:hypothetical protein